MTVKDIWKRNSRGIRLKLIGGGLLLVVVPMAVLGFFSSRQSYNAVAKNAEIQALRTATGLADSVSLVLEEQVRIVRGLSENLRSFGGMDFRFYGGPDIDSLTASRLNASISGTLKELGANYEGIFLTDKDGVAFAGALQNGGTPFYGQDIGNTSYFKKAMDAGQPSSSRAVASTVDRTPVVIFCAPIRDKRGDIAGAIGMTLRMAALSGLVSGTDIGETGYACMVNEEGTIISHRDSNRILTENIYHTSGMETLSGAIKSGNAGLGFPTLEGKALIVGYAPVALKGWTILALQEEAEFKSLAASIQRVTFYLGLGFLGIAVIGVLLFARSIVEPVKGATTTLHRGVMGIAQAAVRVAEASKGVSDVAAEQAAGMEEAAASLAQISTTVTDNAAHADDTNELVDVNRQEAEKANQMLLELKHTMEDLAKATQDVSGIVKTIDGIAFQTNLLSLNASVEAARAGERGAGFAVVAKEVRSLALRSAEAARETGERMVQTEQRLGQSVKLVGVMAETFQNVLGSLDQMRRHVTNIANASREQADGIVLVNQSVSGMEAMLQDHTTHAGESARMSSRMLRDVQTMIAAVGNLLTVIGDSKIREASARPCLYDDEAHRIENDMSESVGVSASMPSVWDDTAMRNKAA
jgi:methyl-accepting chemotaxis protein